MGRLRRFLRRPWRDKLLVGEALVAVSGVRLGLWVARYRRVRRLIEARRLGPRRDAGVSARRVSWAIAHAAPVVPGASCLTQALAALWLLRRRGIEADLRFGVRQRAGAPRLDAHAWLVVEGVVVVGRTADLGEFTVLE
jgi:hypothetical protein